MNAQAASGGAPDALFLSPHLDDAVLSCGGQIHRRTAAGERVAVVTLFAGAPPGDATPLASELHALWGLPADPRDALAARRAEDHAALAVLGAEGTHWDLVDAVYRVAPTPEGLTSAMYPTLRSLFAPRGGRHSEPALLEQTVERLRALPAATRLFAPLGVGRHVDHSLVRSAVELAFPHDPRVRFYEELPYAQRLFAVRKARGRAAPGRRWHSEIVALAPADLEAKCRAIACYASQLRPEYRDEEDLRRKVHDAQRLGGECLWHQSEAR